MEIKINFSDRLFHIENIKSVDFLQLRYCMMALSYYMETDQSLNLLKENDKRFIESFLTEINSAYNKLLDKGVQK